MVYDVGARLKSSCNYFLSWSFISIHYSSFIFQLNLHTSSNYFYVVFLPKKVQFWFVVSVLKDTLLDQGPGPFWATGVAGVSIFYGWDKINSFFSKGWQEIWLPWNWRNKHFLSQNEHCASAYGKKCPQFPANQNPLWRFLKDKFIFLVTGNSHNDDAWWLWHFHENFEVVGYTRILFCLYVLEFHCNLQIHRRANLKYSFLPVWRW